MSSTVSAGTRGAFLRYRVMAFVTGTLLILLVFVALPIKYFSFLGKNDGPTALIGTAHGFLFMVYLVAALDLGIRRRWDWLKLGLVMIAGTIPFASFYAERRIHQEIEAP